MKVVILAGGFGTRIAEDSHLKPKPMIEIGEKPILWHIMKEYSYYGFHEFVICCGYKQHVIKEWFADYYLHNSDITFDFTQGNHMTVHNNVSEAWKVTLVDTGLNTQTGGRIKRIRPYVGDSTFMMTYGDGVSDVDISRLLQAHEENRTIATITSVLVEQRFGVINIDRQGKVIGFREKQNDDSIRINGGYMVLEPAVFDYIEGDDTSFEKDTLKKLVDIGEVSTYRHDGFFMPMDTQREKKRLEELWSQGNPPWKKWND